MKKQTDLTIILDRSESMNRCRTAMNSAINEYLEGLRNKAEQECVVSLVQFDDKPETVFTAQPINSVPIIDIQPRGCTALLDTVAMTIKAVGNRLDLLHPDDRPNQVIVAIVTDGEENSSQIYKDSTVVNAMVLRQQNTYNWLFVFLGANQDAIASARNIGIRNAINFTADVKGIKRMSAQLTGATINTMSFCSRNSDSYKAADVNFFDDAMAIPVPKLKQTDKSDNNLAAA